MSCRHRRSPLVAVAVALLLPAFAGAQLSTAGSQIFHQGVLDAEADTFEQFGSELVTGDFDGDGFDDLAVATPFESVVPFEEAGTVTVIYGGSTGLNAATAEAWTLENATPLFANTEDRLGSALAAADFDGDGYDDLAIGIPGHDVVDSLQNLELKAGAILVLFGAPGGLASTGAQVRTLESGGVTGSADEGDGLGAALAAGDFDGDGYADLAAGLPAKSAAGQGEAGVVNIFHGSSTGLISTATHQTWTQEALGAVGNSEADERFGTTLAAGDLNGDGFDDLAVASPGESWPGAASAGAVHLLYGTSDGLDAAGAVVLAQQTSGFGASEAYDQYGDALAIGDFDGDGLDDLLVGTPYEGIFENGGPIEDAGLVQVYLGVAESGPSTVASTAFNLFDLTGDALPGDRFGLALALGDFDDSAAFELAVGTPGFDTDDQDDAGAAFVLSELAGLQPSEVFAASQAGIVPGAVEVGDELGSALAVGDFDGDGYDDLAAGAPLEESGGNDFAGAVNILYSAGLFRDGFEHGTWNRWSDSAGVF